MDGYTVDLHDADDAGVGLIGGKGIGLRSLVRADFPVPPGFVITTTAYRETIACAGLDGADPQRLRAELPRIDIPTAIGQEILDAHARLGAVQVAVRSSATAEDLAGASFAGQYDTVLSVEDGPAVLDAVRECWASLWVERAVDYRAQNHADDHQLAMAVVVQTMVPAEWAGVMFTVDPVSGHRDRMVLEAVPGLGESLVSGTATGEHLSIDKSTLEFTGDTGLESTLVRRVAELGLSAERRFGAPQDLEWAYAAGTCWLLQARPLTALPPAKRRRRFRIRSGSDRQPRQNPFAVTADHLSQPPYPMDLDLIIRPALGAVLNAIRSAGIDTPSLSEVVTAEDGVMQIIPPKFRPTPRIIVGVPTALPKVVGLLATNTAQWRARCDRTLVPLARRLDTTDLRSLSERQLLDHVRELMTTTGRLTPSRFGAVPVGAVADALAELLLRIVVGGRRARELHSDLMADLDCVTARANAELERLAETVRRDPHLRAVYEEAEPAEIGERLTGFEAGRQLLSGVENYLAVNGYRELVILTVGQPTLRDRPDVVHGLIKGLVGTQHPTGPEAGARARGAWADLSASTGPAAVVIRPVVHKLIRVARDRAAFREDSDYLLAMVPAVARRLLIEVGDRLVGKGILDTADDIAYLEMAEIGLPPERLRALISRRREARDAALNGYTAVPPEYLGLRDDGVVRGTAASPGTYTGVVRVVREAAEFSRLQPGEILVCPYTNPMWTPLFALAGAVVVDSGGAASHAAIVAREYGIPAVMGTGNATAVLADGQRVTVDADRGRVTVHGPARQPETAGQS